MKSTQLTLFEPEYYYRTRYVDIDDVNVVYVKIPKIANLCKPVVPFYFESF